jgi:hypothetical protein
LFFLEVQEEFVVGEEGGLGVFDLRCVRSVLWRVEIIEVGDGEKLRMRLRMRLRLR